jgi:hypothetical protein
MIGHQEFRGFLVQGGGAFLQFFGVSGEEKFGQRCDVFDALSEWRESQADAVDAEVEFASEATLFDFLFDIRSGGANEPRRRGARLCVGAVVRQMGEQQALTFWIEQFDFVEKNGPGFRVVRVVLGTSAQIVFELLRANARADNFSEMSLAASGVLVYGASVGVLSGTTFTDEEKRNRGGGEFPHQFIERADGGRIPAQKREIGLGFGRI